MNRKQRRANISNKPNKSGISVETLPQIFGEALSLQQCGRLNEAILAYGKIIAAWPRLALAHSNLGAALRDLGRLDEAVAACQLAIVLEPILDVAYSNLGNALMDLDRWDEAVAAFRQAIVLKPDDCLKYVNLGIAYQAQLRREESLDCFQTAFNLCPDDPKISHCLVADLQHLCKWEDIASHENHLLELARQSHGLIPPFALVGLQATPSDQLVCASAYGDTLRIASSAFATYRSCLAGEKIRIGYLSADFHTHATAYLIAELIERHDASRFEVTGYSCGADDGSPMRQRLIDGFDHFVDLRHLSDEAAASQIHQDGIDILIDLKGHTNNSRTRILAYRPAPVQVNFLGYPGTMGVDFIDYIIADHFCIQPSHEAFYSEKVVRLPDCYQPNDTMRVIADWTPSRSECGLPEQGFVFCSFNGNWKITPAVFDIWMRLLRTVPGSVLWLLDSKVGAKANLLKEAAARGVDPERLVFAPPLPLAHHLARHRLADLFLDTLPCNAHTTASDALWAGLPVLTCSGQTFAGRVAGSLLTAIGMPELITESLRDYEALALRLATDSTAMSAIRAKLQRLRTTAPLFDIERYTRNIEAAYIRMWEIRCAGLASRRIDITVDAAGELVEMDIMPSSA